MQDVNSKILLSASVAFSFFSCSENPESVSKPNVVFFLVDDLGWSDIGCYGSGFYETPNVDRLAQQGMKFTSAYATCPVCSPTRASILTGKYPARIHLTDYIKGRRNLDCQPLLMPHNMQHLPFPDITIAEALKEHGYTTASIGKWHVGEEFSYPEKHGFDVNVGGYHFGFPPSYFWPYERDSKYNPKIPGLKEGGKEGEYLTDRLTNESIKFIEANKDKPFFLYLSHYAVHDPVQAKEEHIKKYRKKLESMSKPNINPWKLEGNPCDNDKSWMNPEEQERLLQLLQYQGYGYLPNRLTKIKQIQDNPVYAGMVESMDESLGRVMGKLEELNLTENTIVIFMADNGGMSSPDTNSTSNLPLRGAKGWLYEGGIREPMIIKWPGKVKPGSVSDVPVTSTDFYPTILDMVGVDLLPEQHKDGISLVPVLTEQGSLDRNAIFWHWPHYSNHGQQSPASVIRAGDFKLIEYHEDSTLQLFNLKEDIGEQKNLVDEMPEKASQMREMLDTWRKDVNAMMPVANPDYEPKPDRSFKRW